MYPMTQAVVPPYQACSTAQRIIPPSQPMYNTAQPTTPTQTQASANSVDQIMAMLQEVVTTIKNNNNSNNHSRPRPSANGICPERTNRPLVCYSCYQPGHITRECPNADHMNGGGNNPQLKTK